MKKQIKITAITLLSTLAMSCNMKTSDQAELEKLRAVEKAKAEMVDDSEPQTVIVETREVYSEPATVAEKKKMSGALKGALIGAGAGAATGAVVSKKPGKGAVIGGVIGAAGGAVTGDIIENQKAKKQ